MAFVSCYFMGAACRGGTVDACFVHNTFLSLSLMIIIILIIKREIIALHVKKSH